MPDFNKYRVFSGVLFLFFLFSSPGFAIANYTDSLLSVLRSDKKNDTTHVRLLTRIASSYRNINLDSTVYYANKGLQAAIQIHFEKGEAECKHLLGLVYLRRIKYDSALQCYQAALRIYEKTADKKLMCQVIRSIADIYCRQSKIDSSIWYYNENIRISKEINDDVSQGLSYINIAAMYGDQSNYVESINYSLEGLKAFERGKSYQDIAMTMVNIATVYSSMGNYKKAEEYIDKSLAINITNREIRFTNLVNSGSVYTQMKEYSRALSLFNKALVLADSIGDLSWKNICLINIAEAYYRTGSFDTAYRLYTTVLKQNEKINDTLVLTVAKAAMGSILVKGGKLNEGIKELKDALRISDAKGLKQTAFEATGDLATAYEKLHDYKQALYYHKLYHSYSDSLYDDKTNKRVSQMQFDYELNKKEGQIALLSKDKEIQYSKNAQQKIVVWALASGFLLLLIISMMLYRYSVRERRNKDEIQKQALRLEELNRFKDKTFSVLSHDLRGPLGSVTSTMLLLDQEMLTPEEFSGIKPEINRQLNSLNILLDNLLQWAKNYIQGHASAKPEKVNLQKATMYSVDMLHDSAVSKEINIVNDIPASINVLFDPEQLQIVNRNIIMNAIKFTPHKGTVILNAAVVDDRVNMRISDTGVGMTKEQMEMLFTSAPENSTYGTDSEKGTGLGLLLCYEFIKANNAFISVSSEQGKGTTFNIDLPLAQ